MAPEQRERRVADARADQYSFCVSLYEALNGSLPTVDTGPIEKLPADLVRLPSHSVPPHVRAAVRRGLSTRPDARWPSMDALIAELARDPSAKRKRWLVAGGGIAALAAITAALVLVASRGGHEDPCAGASERLAGVWDPMQRGAIERAFTATQTPYAAAAFATIARDLDAYASGWTHSYVESCRATNVRHEQSQEMLDLRTSCLAGRRSEFGAAIELLKTADAKLVRRAVDAVADLSPIASCDELTTVQRLPADPSARREIEAIRAETAQARAQYAAGHFKEALPLAEALYKRSIALAYRPLQAEIALLLGKLQFRSGDPASTAKTDLDGFAAAIAGRDDELEVRLAIGLTLSATDAGQLPRADEWAQVMDAALERIATPSPVLRAAVVSAHAHVLSGRGKFVESAAEHEKAGAIREANEPNSLVLAQTYTALSYVYDESGNYEKARAAGEKGLAAQIALLGPNHPEISKVLNNLGNIAVDEGNIDAARSYYARSLAIREQGVLAGEDPSALADVIHNLGTMALDQEKYDEAIPLFERAIQVRKQGAPDNTEIALPMEGLAIIHQRRHEYAQAFAGFEAAMKVVERLGPEHPYVGDALVGRGAASRELGKLVESQRDLERALAIREKDARPIELGEVQFELGQTLWLRGQKERAMKLVHDARAQKDDSAAAALQRRDIDAWLAKH
jgi:tetratricopeptide (TPR) repeat protein